MVIKDLNTPPYEILISENYDVPCMPGHCLAEIWTRQRPEVCQAATVMTKAS